MHVATRRTLLSRPAAAAVSTWLPTVLASLVAWYDFSDATTLFTDAGTTPVSGDGDLIYQVNDKSGNNRHLSQTTSGSRPAYKTGILNERSIARFDGAGDFLLRADFNITGAQSVTGVIVIIADDTTANQELIDWQTGRLILNHTDNDGTNVAWYDGTWHDTGTAAIAGLQILAYHMTSGGNGVVYRNGGAAIGTAAYTAKALDAFMGFGAKYDGAAGFDGDIAESIICNAALSVSDLNLLGNYLATKWGLAWTTVT